MAKATDAAVTPGPRKCTFGCSPVRVVIAGRRHCNRPECKDNWGAEVDATWIAAGRGILPKSSPAVIALARSLARGGKVPAGTAKELRDAAIRDKGMYARQRGLSAPVDAPTATATGKATTAPRKGRKATTATTATDAVSLAYVDPAGQDTPASRAALAAERDANRAMSGIQRANKRAAVESMDLRSYWNGPTDAPVDAPTDSTDAPVDLDAVMESHADATPVVDLEGATDYSAGDATPEESAA